jgi:hypothetical protein
VCGAEPGNAGGGGAGVGEAPSLLREPAGELILDAGDLLEAAAAGEGELVSMPNAGKANPPRPKPSPRPSGKLLWLELMVVDGLSRSVFTLVGSTRKPSVGIPTVVHPAAPSFGRCTKLLVLQVPPTTVAAELCCSAE